LTAQIIFGLGVLACVAYGLEQGRKSAAFYAERKSHALEFTEAYTSVALGIPGSLPRAEELANQGGDRANVKLGSYLRVMELNAAKQKVEGEDGATKANEVDFSRSTTFIMDRLNYLTDLDLASFLNVNQPIFSKEGRAAYIKHCEEKGCTPAFLHRALTTGLSVDQQQQLSDCFDKIKWKLDSTYQVMFNYEEKGACATAVKS
jgi:hypothetical protein